MKQNRFALGIRILLSVCACACLTGCDTGPKPQPQIEADRLKVATQLRSYFDKTHGDYSALSGPDKADFEKLAGGPAKAEAVFNGMRTGHRTTSAPPGGGNSAPGG